MPNDVFSSDGFTVGDMDGWDLIRYPTQADARIAQRLRLGDTVVDRVLTFARLVSASPAPAHEVDEALYSLIEDALGCWPCPAPDDDFWFLGSLRVLRADGPAREHLILAGTPIFCTAYP